ncbi:hypothetical protein STRTUCAR8_02275, partial [Streptomyces turgidiscabies Car8]
MCYRGLHQCLRAYVHDRADHDHRGGLHVLGTDRLGDRGEGGVDA